MILGGFPGPLPRPARTIPSVHALIFNRAGGVDEYALLRDIYIVLFIFYGCMATLSYSTVSCTISLLGVVSIRSFWVRIPQPPPLRGPLRWRSLPPSTRAVYHGITIDAK